MLAAERVRSKGEHLSGVMWRRAICGKKEGGEGQGVGGVCGGFLYLLGFLAERLDVRFRNRLAGPERLDMAVNVSHRHLPINGRRCLAGGQGGGQGSTLA